MLGIVKDKIVFTLKGINTTKSATLKLYIISHWDNIYVNISKASDYYLYVQ